MFNGHICTEGNIVLKFLVEEGICTEDAKCNLRGDIEILILFEKLTEFCLKVIPFWNQKRQKNKIYYSM